MSISFSGLASGLDTSSWIKSLTALKQAKVTTLEEKKSGVQLQLDTLNNIKTFFNSFRSMLEKVTDTKFNVGSMDLFAQKLVTSSNTNVLTASVKPEALTGTYDIKVENLASNTSAVSGYKEYTSIPSSEKATGSTLLKNIGVKSGNISVDGTLVRVSENDTIDSFARKLNNIGVRAEFDANTGVFSINKDISKINDVDNTGIVSGLHLSGVNHGYSSKPLEKVWTETVSDYADENTELSTFGVNPGRITIRDDSNNVYSVDIERGDTFKDLIDVLNSEGIEASITNGAFSIKNANIVSAGTTNIINALGLSATNVSNMLVTVDLTANRVVTADIDGSTTLEELGLTSDATMIFDNSRLSDFEYGIKRSFVTLTVSKTQTVDEFFNLIKSYDLKGSIKNGSLLLQRDGSSVDGYYLLGGTLIDALGGNFQNVTQQISKGLLYKTTVTATGTTKLSDVGIGNGVISLVNNLNGSIPKSVTITSDMTIGQFCSAVNNMAQGNGINCFLTSDGTLNLAGGSDKTVRLEDTTGTILQDLGLSYSKQVTTTTVGGTWTSTAPVTYTATTLSTSTVSRALTSSVAITKTLTTSTKLSDLGITDFSYEIDGYEKGSYVGYTAGSLSSNATVGDFINACNNNGMNVKLSDGKFVVTPTSRFMTAKMADKLLGTVARPPLEDLLLGTTPSFAYKNIPEQNLGTAVIGTTMEEIGITSTQYLVYASGSSTGTLTVTPTMTIGGVVLGLNTAFKRTDSWVSFQNGKIEIFSGSDRYIKSMPAALQRAFHFADVFDSVENIPSRPIGGSASLFFTTTTTTTLSTATLSTATTFGKLGLTSNAVVTVMSNGTQYTTTVTTATTVGTLASWLQGKGFTASVSGGKFTIGGSSNHYIVDLNDNIDRCLKLPDKHHTNAYTTHVATTYAAPTAPSEVLYELTSSVPLSDTYLGAISDFQAGTVNLVDIYGNYATITISATDTWSMLANKLSEHGIRLRGFNQVSGTPYYGAVFESQGAARILGNNSDSDSNSNLYSLLFERGATGEAVFKRMVNYTTTPKTVELTNQPLTYDTTLGQANIADTIMMLHDSNHTLRLVTTTSDTIADLCTKLTDAGFNAYLNDDSQLVIKSTDGSMIRWAMATGPVAPPGSQYLYDVLSTTDVNNYETSDLIAGSHTVTHTAPITEDTKISETNLAGNNAAGALTVTVDGVGHNLTLTSSETFGSLINKFKDIGVNAAIDGNKFVINGGNRNISITGKTSQLISTLGLTYNANLGGYASSSEQVNEISYSDGYVGLSAAKYANRLTKLKDLNITAGTFSLFKGGEKHTITIEEEDAVQDLGHKMALEGFDLSYSSFVTEGKFVITDYDGAVVTVGTTTDTSNIQAVLGLESDGQGGVVSARTVYCVNGNSTLTKGGLFRAGTVTEGTFTIGDAEFEITSDTTLNSLISQINSSQKSNATAYWDSVKGQLVIKSRSSGSVFVNIESGTSNFTDILGFTATERNADNSIDTTKLETGRQILGENARFSINGTDYTSTTNTITSDISRIEGLTINLKNITENDDVVTLEVGQDNTTVSNAMEDIVNAYNDLIENVDKEVARDGNLHNQSTLRLIRNQIRSFMTSSFGGNSTFRNLDSVGISLEAASANNIKTGNINKLSFNKEKFEQALSNNQNSLKALLVGDDTSKGILTRVEDLLEQTLSTGTGYFSSAERAYNKQIERYNNQITKANASVERYRALLERKFKSMDSLIAQMQQQYSSFLGV